MKKITKKNLEKLEKEMPTLSEGIIKPESVGWLKKKYKKSCVYYALDYLDGNTATAKDYYDYVSGEYGVVPDKHGGIPTAYINQLGGVEICLFTNCQRTITQVASILLQTA